MKLYYIAIAVLIGIIVFLLLRPRKAEPTVAPVIQEWRKTDSTLKYKVDSLTAITDRQKLTIDSLKNRYKEREKLINQIPLRYDKIMDSVRALPFDQRTRYFSDWISKATAD